MTLSGEAWQKALMTVKGRLDTNEYIRNSKFRMLGDYVTHLEFQVCLPDEPMVYVFINTEMQIKVCSVELPSAENYVACCTNETGDRITAEVILELAQFANKWSKFLRSSGLSGMSWT